MTDLFRCIKCNVVDSVVLTPITNRQYLCSKCNPDIGEWHGEFPREEYDPEYDLVINVPQPVSLG